MERRAQRAQTATDRLSHNVEDLRTCLSAMADTIDSLRRDVRSLRRMSNKKDNKLWRFTGK